MVPRILLLVLVVTAACSDPVEPGPEWDRRVGFIGIIGDRFTQPLILPDSVRIGHPAAITVTTYGSSSCVRAAGADITPVSSALIEVTPFDSVAPPQALCSQDVAPHPRAVLVTAGAEDLVIRLIADAYVVEEDLRRLDTLEATLRVYEPPGP